MRRWRPVPAGAGERAAWLRRAGMLILPLIVVSAYLLCMGTGIARASRSGSIGGATTKQAATVDAYTFSGSWVDNASTPTISAAGLPAGWSRIPVNLTFTAAGGGPSGASAEYQLDGGPWTSAVSLTVSAQGSYTLAYRALSGVGLVSQTATATFAIDTSGPITATEAAKGKNGHAITLKYRIVDNLSPQATTISLTIKNSQKKVVKRFSLGSKATGVWLSVKWRPKVKGRDTYTVSAEDLAGNPQTKATGARITVE